MKITTFNPMIIIPDVDPVVSLFEDLGFVKRHTKKEHRCQSIGACPPSEN